MSSLFTALTNINPSKTIWAIKVRCVKVYEVPGYAGGDRPFSIECVLHDKEGNRIHGSIKRDLIPIFRPLIQEGGLYAIKYFVVTNNTMRYKTTCNQYKIVFQARSKVVAISESGFPVYTYEFQQFSHLNNQRNMDEARLIDVIGRVVTVGPVLTKDLKDGPTKHMDIILEDTERNRIGCTLWGNFPDVLNKFLEGCGSEPVIIILQMFKQKVYRDQVNLSNTYYVSRLVCDNTAAEVIDFKSRMGEDREEGEIVSVLRHPDSILIEREFNEGRANIRCIDQLKYNRELGSYWVHAEMVDVLSKNDWWYLACSKCKKKLEQCAGTHYCERCDSFEEFGKIRFKIGVKVVDNTGEAEFIIWDSEASTLIGKEATELRDAVSRLNLQGLPSEILMLCGKRALFKVQVRAEQVRRNSGPYTVMRVTTDSKLLSKYGAELSGNEVFEDLFRVADEVIKNVKQTDGYITFEGNSDLNTHGNQFASEEIVFAPPNSPINYPLKISHDAVEREFPMMGSAKKCLFGESSCTLIDEGCSSSKVVEVMKVKEEREE